MAVSKFLQESTRHRNLIASHQKIYCNCFHYFYFLNQNSMKKIPLILLTFLLSVQLSAQKIYIWCGTLIDGISDEPKKNMTIVIEKNKIVSIENGFSSAGSNDKTI